MNAESAYLFRHALLRDAAYQLQLPGDRARLHGLALAVIEAVGGGRPAAPAPLVPGRESDFAPHASDPWAHELAEHARLASADRNEGAEELRPTHLLYLRRAAEHAERHFLNADAIRLWEACERTEAGNPPGEALRRAAMVALLVGRSREGESLLYRALAAHRGAGNRGGEAVVLGNRAGLCHRTGPRRRRPAGAPSRRHAEGLPGSGGPATR